MSPSTKIVVVSDDAHTERIARLNTVNQVLSHPIALDNSVEAAFENGIFEQADAVMTVSEADQELLAAQLKGSTPVVTVHWGHKLSSLPVAKAADVAAFDKRSGLVFVGYGKNPSNQVGLQWFFDKVYPLMKSRLPNERVYIVGEAPEDGFASLSKSGARIIPMSQRDDASMRTILSSARVMIAPIFSTGLTTKILLGLSNGVPVVSTRMAAGGYKWSGQEQEFENAMLVAHNAKDFADAVVRLSTDAAEWSKFSAGGLQLASTQTQATRFGADVRSLLSGLQLKAAPALSPAVPFVASTGVRAMEVKLKNRNPFELMAGTGGSGMSSSGMDDPCGGDKITTLVGGLFAACQCADVAGCLQKDKICDPTPACAAGAGAILACADAPAFQDPSIQGLFDQFTAIAATCGDKDSGAAANVISIFALLSTIGVLAMAKML